MKRKIIAGLAALLVGVSNAYSYMPEQAFGADYSVSAAVSAEALKIESQPKNFIGEAGETAVFTVKAKGKGLTYQWQYNKGGGWKNSSADGAQTASVQIEATENRDKQKYRCIVTDANGSSVTSDAAKIKVRPQITAQPKNLTVNAGETAKFSVQASGKKLTYQWQYNKGFGWKNSGMTGADTAELCVKAAAKRSGQQYRCVIRSASGASAVTETAVLTVNGIEFSVADAVKRSSMTEDAVSRLIIDAAQLPELQYSPSQEYTNEFFKDHALIFAVGGLGTLSESPAEIKTVCWQDGTIIVNGDVYKTGNCEIEYWYFFIEVSKADLPDANADTPVRLYLTDPRYPGLDW